MKYGHFSLLPERAFLKVGGKIMPQGGGSGGSSSAPTSQTVTQTSIPEYARPYAESMLGQTSALTDINQNPYQPYKGQMTAGFSPMQVQGMTGIANQQVAPQITDASNFAFQSGAGGLGAYQNSAALQNASLGYGSQGNQFAIQNANLANQYAGQGVNSAAVNAALANSYAGAGAQGAFANADLINAYGGEAFKSGQLGQQLGVEGGAKFGNMGSAFGQQGADIGTTGGAYYGGQGMGYGAQGANLAGANLGVGMTGMQAGLGYGQGAQNPYAVQGYMNPYLQASLQPQLQEMQRQYGISGAQGQSNATKAGAFGGSREALIFAENQRNKNIAMNQAIGQGYNTAYDVANRNMQAAASLGMQGAGVGLQGLQGANQNYLTGLQGAQTGLQGVNTQLAGTAQGMQGAQVGLAGVDRQLAGTAQGMQGASIGMQGANQAGQLMIGGGQLGLQGAQTAGNMGIAGANLGMQGAQTAGNLGISGSNAGMQGVQGAVGAGQYGLAGLGLAGSAASTLGALGQTQFGQQQAINQAQLQAGAQQQALQQQGLNVAYQQYQDQMNYPYKQLAFQSDMMRGLPMSQASQTMYQNTGAMAPQLVGAGLAAYGASQKGAKEGGLMSYARGGAVKGYAMGGQPVDPRAMTSLNPAERPSKLSQLSDGQLQAYARTVKDAVALAEVKAEMARRAGVRQPQGEEPTQTVAQEVAGQGGIAEQPMMAAAGGGIVALNKGGEGRDDAPSRDVAIEYDDNGKIVNPYTRGRPNPAATSEIPRNPSVPILINTAPSTPVGQTTIAPGAVLPPAAAPSLLAPTRSGIMLADSAPPSTAPDQYIADQNARVAADAEGAQYGEQIAAEQQVRQTQPTFNPPADTGGITSVAAPAGAPGAAPAGGIVPAGGPAAARTPGGMATAPGAAGSGDIFGWGTYAANVAKAAELDPEDKATLADLQKRTERKMQRAEKQERGVMSEAMIAGGIAMMGGMNLSDGVRRMAEAGGKQYFSSQAEARKAIEKADEAQDAFDQYKMSFKQGNKKLAAEMYGKYFNAVVEYKGKIEAAGIGAGASMANAKAQQEANAIRQAEVNRSHVANEQLRKDALDVNAQLARERLAATNYANNTQRQNAIRTYVQSDPAVVSLKEAGKNWANLPSSPEYKNNQALLQAAQRDALEEFHRIERQVAARGKTSTATGELPPLSSFQK